jgi:hypothetical protein
LGDPTPEGAPIEAFRRALGYQHSYDFQKACDANDPDLGERMRQATTKLLAKFGVSWEHEWDEILEAFNRMEAGFSERYRAGCR